MTRRVAAVLLAAVLLGPATTAAAADCSRAERLATIDLTAARAEYVALLASGAAPACAEPGLRKVSESQRAVAALILQAEDEVVLGRDIDALGFVAKALDLDPSNGPARTLLTTMAAKGASPKPSMSGFEGAQALWDAGYKTEARDQAKKVAAEKGLAIPAELRSSDPSVASRVKSGTADVATYASGVAVVLVILAAVLALVGKIWSGVVRRRFINLGAFTSQPKAAEPTGDVIKAVVAEEFAAAAKASSTFQVVDAGAVELPDFLDVPEQLKPFAKLLQVLFRRTVLTLSATARDRGGGRWQVTGQIATRRRVKRQETFEVPASAGSDPSVVGVFLAAWALCAMGSLIGWRWRRRSYPLGTASWKSLASVRLADHAGGPDQEEEHLHRSLAHDHRNVVALARLGFIETDPAADEAKYQAGLDHLAAAARVLESQPTQRPRLVRGRPHRAGVQWEGLWFQISYLRTVALLHRYYTCLAQSRAPDPWDLTAAQTEGLALEKAIASTWLSVHGPWRRFAVRAPRRQELAAMLDADTEYYLGVLAGALAESAPAPGPAGGDALQGKALWKWLADFQTDRDLNQLLLQATTESPDSSVRTLYNIACVWTRIGQYDKALDSLRMMFARAPADEIADRMDLVAKQDPTLAPLRNSASAPTLTALLVEVAKRVPKKELRTSATPAKAGRWTVEVLTAPVGGGGEGGREVP